MVKLNYLYASKLDSIVDVKERNVAFDQLSDEEQRKEIAWDSLKLVMAKKIDASYGHYWYGEELDYLRHKVLTGQITSSVEVQEKALAVQHCSVCARGAIMLSQIRLNNNICDPAMDRGEEGLVKGFDMWTMGAMEAEFEHNVRGPYDNNTIENLANILLNVLHNGNFDDDDETDYVKQYTVV